MEDYKKLSEIALNLTKDKGATYADIRIERIEDENLSVKNQTPELIDRSSDFGFGVRVIVDGAWGFAASADLNENDVKKISLQAVDSAKASSRLKKKDVVLAPLEKTIDS
ncbi:MAG: PmbA/TldA family metallopeptidase, partial [Candidatus Zixiibacteriota bacterium]